MIISAIPILRAVFLAITTIRRRRMTGIVMGFTLLGGGSSLEFALYMQVMQKSTFLLMSRRELGAQEEVHLCNRPYALLS